MKFEMSTNWMQTLMAFFAACFLGFVALQIQRCETAKTRAQESCMVECIKVGGNEGDAKSCVRICDTNTKVEHTIDERDCIVDCIKADKSPIICEDACTIQ